MIQKGDNNMLKKAANKNEFNFNAYVSKKLKNPKIRKVYDEEWFITSAMAELYELRKKANITQKEMAKRLDISQSELSRIETGNQNIILITLYRLLKSMGRKPQAMHDDNRNVILL
jgi:DNA-binding XRE family transcriptional regulator